MKKHEAYEDEISLLNLLFFVISKWKSILLITIIGLILGIGVNALSDIRKPDKNTALEEIQRREEQQKILENYEFQKGLYRDAVKLVESIEKHSLKSALMQMDSFEIYRGTLTYVISCSFDNMETVRAKIRSFIWDGKLIGSLNKSNLFTKEDLEVLIQLATNDENGYYEVLPYQEIGQDESQTVIVDPNMQGKINVRIAIMAEKEEEAKILIQCMKDAFEEVFSGFQNQGLTEKNELINEKIEYGVSSSLANYQVAQMNTYKSALNNRDVCEAAFEAVELQMLSIPTQESNRGVFSVLGLILAMLVTVFAWMVIYLFSNKLFVISNKESALNVMQLASIHNFGRKKGLDLWLAQKLGGIYSELPLEEQRKVALLNIENAIEKTGIGKKIFIVSTQGDTLPEAQLLIEQLRTDGYTVEGCENIIGRADVIQRAAQCDAALIIEDNQKSKTALVKEEVNILNNYMNNVLGMVVVEG